MNGKSKEENGTPYRSPVERLPARFDPAGFENPPHDRGESPNNHENRPARHHEPRAEFAGAIRIR